jgi:hypothetical protein
MNFGYTPFLIRVQDSQEGYREFFLGIIQWASRGFRVLTRCMYAGCPPFACPLLSLDTSLATVSYMGSRFSLLSLCSSLFGTSWKSRGIAYATE